MVKLVVDPYCIHLQHHYLCEREKNLLVRQRKELRRKWLRSVVFRRTDDRMPTSNRPSWRGRTQQLKFFSTEWLRLSMFSIFYWYSHTVPVFNCHVQNRNMAKSNRHGYFFGHSSQFFLYCRVYNFISEVKLLKSAITSTVFENSVVARGIFSGTVLLFLWSCSVSIIYHSILYARSIANPMQIVKLFVKNQYSNCVKLLTSQIEVSFIMFHQTLPFLKDHSTRLPSRFL